MSDLYWGMFVKSECSGPSCNTDRVSVTVEYWGYEVEYLSYQKCNDLVRIHEYNYAGRIEITVKQVKHRCEELWISRASAVLCINVCQWSVWEVVSFKDRKHRISITPQDGQVGTRSSVCTIREHQRPHCRPVSRWCRKSRTTRGSGWGRSSMSWGPICISVAVYICKSVTLHICSSVYL